MNKGYEPTEAEVKVSVINCLDTMKIMWWPQQSGVATYKGKNNSERRVRYGFKGISDIACVIRPSDSNRGVYVAIEIKNPTEYNYILNNYDRIKSGKFKSKRDQHIFDQIAFIENVKDRKAVGFFVDSIDTLIRELENYKLI